MPRVFDKVRCAHYMKELHGNGLRAHVAQVHPEQYARSRSVRAHRMKEKRSGSAGAWKEERDRARKSHKGSPAPSKEVKGALPLETRAETTARIWGEVRKRDATADQETHTVRKLAARGAEGMMQERLCKP